MSICTSSPVKRFETFFQKPFLLPETYFIPHTMAPSVVSIGGVAVELTTNTGPYKEVERGHLTFKKENELKGFGKFGQASYPHYLPTWKLTGPEENGGV